MKPIFPRLNPFIKYMTLNLESEIHMQNKSHIFTGQYVVKLLNNILVSNIFTEFNVK